MTKRKLSTSSQANTTQRDAGKLAAPFIEAAKHKSSLEPNLTPPPFPTLHLKLRSTFPYTDFQAEEPEFSSPLSQSEAVT